MSDDHRNMRMGSALCGYCGHWHPSADYHMCDEKRAHQLATAPPLRIITHKQPTYRELVMTNQPTDTRTISPTGAHSNSIGTHADARESVVHVVKSWPWLFEPMRVGAKKADIRNKRERHYRIGDFMRLQEFDPRNGQYTGRELLVKITHMIDNNTPCALSSTCLADDFVVLSVERADAEYASPGLKATLQGDIAIHGMPRQDSGATGPKYAPVELEKLSKIRADVEKRMPPLESIPFGPTSRPQECGVVFRFTGSFHTHRGNWSVCAASLSGDPDGPWTWTRDL